jgi:hypothetical protein
LPVRVLDTADVDKLRNDLALAASCMPNFGGDRLDLLGEMRSGMIPEFKVSVRLRSDLDSLRADLAVGNATQNRELAQFFDEMRAIRISREDISACRQAEADISRMLHRVVLEHRISFARSLYGEIDVTEIIELAGKTYTLATPNIRTAVDLAELIEQPSPSGLPALIRRSATIVALGLRRHHPDVTAEMILDLDLEVEQLGAVVDRVLRAAGYALPARTPVEQQPETVPAA